MPSKSTKSSCRPCKRATAPVWRGNSQTTCATRARSCAASRHRYRRDLKYGRITMTFTLGQKTTRPDDGFAGPLVGRAWLPQDGGPAVILVREDGVYDITRSAPTVSGLLNGKDPLAVIRAAPRDRRLGSLAELLANTPPDNPDPRKPHLLAPVDLQALHAAGVTFAQSLLDRVVEEQSRGDPGRANEVRASLTAEIGPPPAIVNEGGAPVAAR